MFTHHNRTHNCLPQAEPSGSKQVEDVVKRNENISVTKVHFVGLYHTYMTMHSAKNIKYDISVISK